ncbi:MAG: hypothetical protein KC431_16395 [Myxococcales bacterium]|nr:hypothetical protein [Myxococcales bacterium]
MAGLGSIYDDEQAAGGPDLRVTAEVPRAALGHGVRVRIPRRLAADGDLVDRVCDAADPERVVLHLPEQLPPGAMLRLRGQGGLRDGGGRPGDLFVVIELVDRPAEADELIVTATDLVPASGAGGRDLTWAILAVLALLAATTVAIFAL